MDEDCSSRFDDLWEETYDIRSEITRLRYRVEDLEEQLAEKNRTKPADSYPADDIGSGS